nr:MAG TPA: hypothetical protein [Caudoviricetes sp.]
MKGYKGFSKGLVCRGKQYAENTIFEENDAKICESGIHFCKNPFDVLDYYGFVNDNSELNEFAEVESLDDTQTDDGKKFCTKKLKVGAKLGIAGLINAFVNFTLSKTKSESAAMNTGWRSAAMNTGDHSAATNTGYCSAATNTGYFSAATNTGDHSAATNTGDRSAATNTGYCSAATNTGKNGFAISTGIEGKAKGALGCYIAVAEWTYDETADEYKLVGFKAHKVDGKEIKPDTFYALKNGKFVAVK